MEPPAAIGAVVVKVTKTVANEPGRRGWIVRETPVTWPPRAPEAAPAETRSVLVETDIPVGKPGLGAPIVTPDIVTVNAPATTAAVVVRTTELKPIAPMDADKPASDVGVTPFWKKKSG